MKIRDKLCLLMLSLWMGIFIWSAINPLNIKLWIYEVSGAFLLAAALLVTYRRFRLTPLAYVIVFIAIIIMLIGGHYTYSEVPYFNEIKEVLSLKRNNFDRFGHFFQGMVIAVLFREYLVRKGVIRDRNRESFVIFCISLAFSAAYELFEFFFAILCQLNISKFLGEQGDRWDTHWDMASAFLGALIFLLFLRNCHDKQIRALEKNGI